MNSFLGFKPAADGAAVPEISLETYRITFDKNSVVARADFARNMSENVIETTRNIEPAKIEAGISKRYEAP